MLIDYIATEETPQISYCKQRIAICYEGTINDNNTNNNNHK